MEIPAERQICFICPIFWEESWREFFSFQRCGGAPIYLLPWPMVSEVNNSHSPMSTSDQTSRCPTPTYEENSNQLRCRIVIADNTCRATDCSKCFAALSLLMFIHHWVTSCTDRIDSAEKHCSRKINTNLFACSPFVDLWSICFPPSGTTPNCSCAVLFSAFLHLVGFFYGMRHIHAFRPESSTLWHRSTEVRWFFCKEHQTPF